MSQRLHGDSSHTNQGVLYLVPTPIGNLDDMTFRAVHTLRAVDLIACEDTRHTKKLLYHFEIDQPTVSYHEHNQAQKGPLIVQELVQGKSVAYVTDAGTPAISDPGADLVRLAVAEEIQVIPLPGANAALTALVGSGLPTDQFLFVGFLDRQSKKRKKTLEGLRYVPYTMIFYESPHRLKETVQDLYTVLENREVAVAKELTKKHEQFRRGTLKDIVDWSGTHEPRGEYCIIVSGTDDVQAFIQEREKSKQPPWWEALTVKEHVQHYVLEGERSKEAIKRVAKERRLSKREVYRAYHIDNSST